MAAPSQKAGCVERAEPHAKTNSLVNASEEDERLCRFCFEGEEEGELVSPCRCTGGQKWIHLKCLRAWQRTVLVSQPVHPDLYDNDTRQRVCNVCKAEFTTPPPTRQELLASFTGPELAALIEEGCVIGSADDFSRELQRQVAVFPEAVRESVVCRNWIRGVFLITKVVEDRERSLVRLTVDEEGDLSRLLQRLGDDCRTLHLRGRRFALLPEGPFEGLSESSPPELWREALNGLEFPATLQLRPDQVADCGEDGIVAVNLTRPIDLSATRTPLNVFQRTTFQAAVKRMVGPGGDCGQSELRAEVTHFVGGPCEEEQVAACVILCGGDHLVVQEGCVLHTGLEAAERAAAAAAAGHPAPLRADEAATTEETAAAPPPPKRLRSHHFACGPCRRRRAPEQDAEPQQPSPPARTSDAHPAEATPPTVRLFVYWGYAGWSRCQLVGEIARGSWGMCRAPDNLIQLAPTEAWSAVYSRLVFAPKSEMSERYDAREPDEEAQLREMRRMAILHDLIRRGPSNTQRRASATIPDTGEGGDERDEEGYEDDEQATAPGALSDPEEEDPLEYERHDEDSDE